MFNNNRRRGSGAFSLCAPRESRDRRAAPTRSAPISSAGCSRAGSPPAHRASRRRRQEHPTRSPVPRVRQWHYSTSLRAKRRRDRRRRRRDTAARRRERRVRWRRTARRSKSGGTASGSISPPTVVRRTPNSDTARARALRREMDNELLGTSPSLPLWDAVLHLALSRGGGGEGGPRRRFRALCAFGSTARAHAPNGFVPGVPAVPLEVSDVESVGSARSVAGSDALPSGGDIPPAGAPIGPKFALEPPGTGRRPCVVSD